MPSRPVDLMPTDPTTLHVDGPGALVQAIPYLLGFHPVASMVLVGLRAGHVAVTARMDLGDLCLGDLVDRTVEVLGGNGADQVMAVAYVGDDEPEVGPNRFLETL